jgi:hypothetical protein
VNVCCDWFVRVALRPRGNYHAALYIWGNCLRSMVLRAPTKEIRTRQVMYTIQPWTQCTAIPVPNSCNCDVVPNERANTASTLIASRYPIIINDMGRFERICFIATALVLISSHTHRQTRICAQSALSNSQMCISVIETKRSPIHGSVPLHSGYDGFPPGLPANHIALNPLDGG